MDNRLVELLDHCAEQNGTPCYVYDERIILHRHDILKKSFPAAEVSFAVKANPNPRIIQTLSGAGLLFDASSRGEIELLLSLGVDKSRISFSGPAKKASEIEYAVNAGIECLVIESLREAEVANFTAERLMRPQQIALRIAPDWIPPKFGAPMGGRPTQFGVDEGDMEQSLRALLRLDYLDISGVHLFSGTNCLSEESLVEGFRYNLTVALRVAQIIESKLNQVIIGTGFGIPYTPGDRELDIEHLGSEIEQFLDAIDFGTTTLVLEMGRWLVGPAGWFLTRVISEKESKGTSFRACDGGFNNHMAACGMLGTAIRKNWTISNLSNLNGELGTYTVVGPLCTSIDVIARNIQLERIREGDLLAVHNSGAYGLSASPFAFISHPMPPEVFVSSLQM